MNKLLRNWSYLLISDVSQTIVNFFVFILLARKLTPEGYGEFNVILALVSIFTVLATNLSSNHVITREITLNSTGSKNLRRKIINLRLLSFILSFFAIFIYVQLKGELKTSVLIFSSLLILANSIWDLSESIAFGFFTTKYTSYFNIIFSIIWLLIVFFTPEDKFSTTFILVSYSILFIIRGVSYFITSNYITNKSSNEFDTNQIISLTYKSIIVMSLPYLGMRFFGAFTDQIPILLLESKSGNQEVAYFSVGSRLIIPITLAISTALRAIFPFLTKLYYENKDEFTIMLTRGFEFVLLWGTIISTVLVLSSTIWIPYFFGNAYNSSVDSFNFLAWFGVGMCFDLFLSTTLSSTYKQNTLAILTAIDFVVLFPLYYLGSINGASGLAIAKLTGMLIILIYHIMVVKRILKVNIKTNSFYFSILFYILLMCITLLINNIVIKLSLITMIFFFYLIIKKSPLRSNIDYIISFLKKD